MRKWLHDIRINKNMTHDEVAKRAGIQRAYYTMIENGKRNPSVAVAKELARVLEFDWTIFFENKCNIMTLKKNSA
ncbi:helix-turn-helix transcriptional regulator [Schinkia sp. CFF1]